MGGLAHYFEEAGLSTTQVSLIREHTVKMRPPRALWVPFELGRPLGAPGDGAFQRRVLSAALALLEAKEGPVLADFPEEAPAGSVAEGASGGLACPVDFRKPAGESPEARTPEALAQEEIRCLAPWYDLAVRRRGRTTVGLGGLDIGEAARYAASYLSGNPLPNPRPDLPEAETLRLATEDLKAYYLEAATAQPGAPAGKALADWFWGETAAGKMLLSLKTVCEKSPDPGMRDLGKIFLVPRAQEGRLK